MKRLAYLIIILVLAIVFIVYCGTTGSVDEDTDDDATDDDVSDDDATDDDTTDDDADDDTDDDTGDDDNYIDCANQDNLGWDVGDTSSNYALTDEEGNSLSLYDLCDNVVLVVTSTGWCPNCAIEAENIVEDIYNQYINKPFKIFYALVEDANGNPPSQEYLQQYKEYYGFPFHVYDDRYCKTCRYQSTFPPSISIPYNVVLDKQMIIRYEQAGYSPWQINYHINQHIDD